MTGNLFCGLRNRTTEGERPQKPRNTKENRHTEGFSTVSKAHAVLPSSPRDNFHCFSVRLWTLFCRKLDGFGVVRVPQKCSVLLRKEQARSTQGTRIASENKSLMKQEIVPQGAYLLLFCVARLFLLPFRSC